MCKEVCLETEAVVLGRSCKVVVNMKNDDKKRKFGGRWATKYCWVNGRAAHEMLR